MKRVYPTLLIFLLCSVLLPAQNLVNNGDFETYSSCPTSSSQLANATPWLQARNSPEYMHTCSGSQYSTLPTNFWGTEAAGSGSACFGGLCYGSFASNYLVNLREFGYTTLSTPLVVGQTYYVSLKVNLADRSSHACNNIGMRFGTSYSSNAPLNNLADVYTTNVITQTNGWTTISGTFVANAAYNSVYIGNFFDDANTTVNQLQSPQIGWNAYYFFDDICVSPNPIACGPVVLAMDFGDIQAHSSDGKRVDVVWTCQSDVEVTSMMVERSLDGEEFKQIRSVEPTATTDQLVGYEIADMPLSLDNRVYYRVRAVDANGAMHLSKVAQARLDNEALELFSIAPNPLGSQASLALEIAHGVETGAQIEVYDELGRMVWNHQVTADDVYQGVTVAGNTFEAGIYHLVLKDGNRRAQKTLIVVP